MKGGGPESSELARLREGNGKEKGKMGGGLSISDRLATIRLGQAVCTRNTVFSKRSRLLLFRAIVVPDAPSLGLQRRREQPAACSRLLSGAHGSSYHDLIKSPEHPFNNRFMIPFVVRRSLSSVVSQRISGDGR